MLSACLNCKANMNPNPGSPNIRSLRFWKILHMISSISLILKNFILFSEKQIWSSWQHVLLVLGKFTWTDKVTRQYPLHAVPMPTVKRSSSLFSCNLYNKHQLITTSNKSYDALACVESVTYESVYSLRPLRFFFVTLLNVVAIARLNES